MKKLITVVLEVENDDEHMMKNSFIEDDIKTEINCASNYYDVISITIEVI